MYKHKNSSKRASNERPYWFATFTKFVLTYKLYDYLQENTVLPYRLYTIFHHIKSEYSLTKQKTRSAKCKACFDFVLLLSVVTDNKFLDFCGIHDIDFTVMVVIRKFSLNIRKC